MTLLYPFARAEKGRVLKGARVTLRSPAAADFASWADLRERSRAHLQPWEPAWTQDELTKASFRRRLTRYAREIREDRAYPFFAFLEGEVLIGGATLSNVRRGVAQAATLGYWVGLPFPGKGLMSEIVQILLPHAFGPLGLHRVEAACLPGNLASIRVLEKNGFRDEGFAREYLRINGAWRDHRLFARLQGDGVIA